MKKVVTVMLILTLLGMVAASGCLDGGEESSKTSPTSSTTAPTSSLPMTSKPSETTTSQAPQSWEMELVWNVSTSGIPLLDMSPDGSLSAVIDWNNADLYLVKPSGESVTFDLQGDDAVEPVVVGVVVRDREAHVLADYAEFAGVRIYSWEGQTGEERHGWAGAVADSIAISPSGNHLCYLITTGATTQELYCDGVKTTIENAGGYNMVDVSDTGLVAVGSGGEAGDVLIFKNGSRVMTLSPDSHMVVLYGDRIIGQFEGELRVLDAEGNVLARSGQYCLRWYSLLIPSVRATEKYLLWTDEFEGTRVLTWNMTEVKSLEGFMRFANENFVVTVKGGVIHCYSLRDFHEVFSVKVPGESLGYVRLSDDGRVLLVSGEFGSFWLYVKGLTLNV
ncbi:hypothetical protein [Thermococcus pacificus]|uniref:Dehydrogenase n=1 Tax=Thermococcus pacificus TaxID=71998 RepID=A0A218P6R0_9EURY|nr:hypothetical protein [Thermococcus pacificus]ASJ06466.1 hypothetical protein A3L08_03550 [Thermococcus pacificus]